jgi:hypothetical protein
MSFAAVAVGSRSDDVVVVAVSAVASSAPADEPLGASDCPSLAEVPAAADRMNAP